MQIASLMRVNLWHKASSQDSFARLSQACERLIESQQGLAADLGRDLTRIDHVFLLGSDALYGVACEGALKLTEMSLTRAEAFHFLEVRHGPKGNGRRSDLGDRPGATTGRYVGL